MTSFPRQPEGAITLLNLQVVIRALIGKGHVLGSSHLLLVLCEDLEVDLGSRRGKGGGGDKFLKENISIVTIVWGGSGLGGAQEDSKGRGRTRPGLPTSLRASQRKGFSKL